MKKKSFYLFAMMMAVVLCVGFTSCSSSDDDDLGSSVDLSNLVGTWEGVSEEARYEDGKVIISDMKSYLHFNANGTVDRYEYNTTTGEWEITNGIYKFDGKIIAMAAIDDIDYVYKNEVVSLTQSELILKRDGYEEIIHGEIITGIGYVEKGREKIPVVFCWEYKKVSDSVLDNIK